MKIREAIQFCFRNVAVSCLLSCILFAAASAQTRSTISGYVFGPQRSPVGQVPVELRDDVNGVVGRARTDGSGHFIFFGVPNGRFSVTVLPLGTNLEGQSQEVEIAGIGARGQPVPQTAQVDFYLRRTKAAELAENSVVFAQEVPDTAKRAYESAVSDLESQRTEQGVVELKRAVEIFPTYFLALQRLGAEQLKREEYEEAKKSFVTALSVNQRSFLCWYGLTYANFVLKKWKDVLESSEKVLELDKNSINTLLMLGISQRNLQRYPEAERSLLRAKKIDEGKTPDIYWNLALLYAYNLKKYQDAADALELYLKANPSIPDTTNIKKLIKQFRENRPPSE